MSEREEAAKYFCLFALVSDMRVRDGIIVRYNSIIGKFISRLASHVDRLEVGFNPKSLTATSLRQIQNKKYGFQCDLTGDVSLQQEEIFKKTESCVASMLKQLGVGPVGGSVFCGHNVMYFVIILCLSHLHSPSPVQLLHPALETLRRVGEHALRLPKKSQKEATDSSKSWSDTVAFDLVFSKCAFDAYVKCLHSSWDSVRTLASALLDIFPPEEAFQLVMGKQVPLVNEVPVPELFKRAVDLLPTLEARQLDTAASYLRFLMLWTTETDSQHISNDCHFVDCILDILKERGSKSSPGSVRQSRDAKLCGFPLPSTVLESWSTAGLLSVLLCLCGENGNGVNSSFGNAVRHHESQITSTVACHVLDALESIQKYRPADMVEHVRFPCHRVAAFGANEDSTAGVLKRNICSILALPLQASGSSGSGGGSLLLNATSSTKSSKERFDAAQDSGWTELCICFRQLQTSVRRACSPQVQASSVGSDRAVIAILCCQILIAVLTVCKHNGVIHAATTALGAMLRSVRKLSVSFSIPSTEQSGLVPFRFNRWIAELLSEAVEHFAESRCITQRKSAGLPFLVLVLMQCAPATDCSATVLKLLALSQQQGFESSNASSTEWCEKPSVAATHTLNLLCSNVATSHYIVPHYASCLATVIRGLGAKHSYNIRQASLCFYGLLVSRMVCHKRGRDEHNKDVNANPAIPVAAFFKIYPGLFDTCIEYLGSDNDSVEEAFTAASSIGSVSPTYAVLLLLSRLGKDALKPVQPGNSTVDAQWWDLLNGVVDFGMTTRGHYSRRLAAAAAIPLITSDRTGLLGQRMIQRIAVMVLSQQLTANYFNAVQAACSFLGTCLVALHTDSADSQRANADPHVATFREAQAFVAWLWDLVFKPSLPALLSQSLIQLRQIAALVLIRDTRRSPVNVRFEMGLGRNDLICGGVSAFDGADTDTLMLGGLLPLSTPLSSEHIFPSELLDSVVSLLRQRTHKLPAGPETLQAASVFFHELLCGSLSYLRETCTKILGAPSSLKQLVFSLCVPEEGHDSPHQTRRGDDVTALSIHFLRQAAKQYGFHFLLRKLDQCGLSDEFWVTLAEVSCSIFCSANGSNVGSSIVVQKSSPFYDVGVLRLVMDFLEHRGYSGDTILAQLEPVLSVVTSTGRLHDFLASVCCSDAMELCPPANNVYLLDVCDGFISWCQIEFVGSVIAAVLHHNEWTVANYKVVNEWVEFLKTACAIEETAPEFRAALLSSINRSGLLSAHHTREIVAWQIELASVVLVLTEDVDADIRRNSRRVLARVLKVKSHENAKRCNDPTFLLRPDILLGPITVRWMQNLWSSMKVHGTCLVVQTLFVYVFHSV